MEIVQSEFGFEDFLKEFKKEQKHLMETLVLVEDSEAEEEEEKVEEFDITSLMDRTVIPDSDGEK